MIEGIPILDFTAPSLLGLAIVLLLTGKIVPKAALDDKKEESQAWKKAYETEREARIVSETQTAQLLEVAKTTHALIEAMFRNSEHIKRAGEQET